MPPKRARTTAKKSAKKSAKKIKLPFQENPIVRKKETLKWKLENMESWDGSSIHSQSFDFENLSWKIGMERQISQQLQVFMILSSCKVNGDAWLCQAVFVPRLFVKNGEIQQYCVEETQKIGNFGGYEDPDHQRLSGSFNFSSQMENKDFLSIEISLEFKFYDFSAEVSSIPCVVLKAGFTNFHFDKYMLARLSEVFYNPIVLEEKEQIELDNVRAEELANFLAMVCSVGIAVTDQNVKFLLKLGNMFRIPTFKGMCDSWLTESSKLPKREKIQLADRYGLPKFIKNIDNQFEEMGEIIEMAQWRGFNALKEETRNSINNCVRKFQYNQTEEED